MATKHVFLIMAQMQTGKDTFGKLLADATGGITVSYAQPVKEIAISMLGIPPAVVYGGQEERLAWKVTVGGKEMNAREALQWIGTEIGRMQVSDTVWIERLVEKIAFFKGCHSFVVTDARFKNELLNTEEHLKEAGKQLGHEYNVVKIRLKRPGQENTCEHPSESEQLAVPDSVFDHIIVNNAGIPELGNEATKIASLYLAS